MGVFETIAYCILILVYGAVCYMAGKGDLLNLIPKMLLQKAKEIEESLTQEGHEDGTA